MSLENIDLTKTKLILNGYPLPSFFSVQLTIMGEGTIGVIITDSEMLTYRAVIRSSSLIEISDSKKPSLELKCSSI